MNIHTCPTREVAAMNMWLNIAKCADERGRSLEPHVDFSAEMVSRNAAFSLMAAWRQRIHA